MSRLTMSFVGDICLGLGIRDCLARHGPDWPFRAIASRLGGADLVIGNLECALVDGTCPDALRREPMAVDVELASGLKAAGFTALALSNNHTMDCGPAGLQATRAFLDAQGIITFGAGGSLAEATAPVFVTRHGKRIALLGGCDVSRCHASGASAGVAPMHRQALLDRTRAARAQADVVVVVLHADLEFSFHPAPARVHMSRDLVKAGAALVIQHHPHVCQGVEQHAGGLIAYSLGNFVFHVHGNAYQQPCEGTTEGAILSVTLELDGREPTIAWEWIPTLITKDNQTAVSDAVQTEAQLRRLQETSTVLSDRRALRRLWRKRCHQEVRNTLYTAYCQLMRRDARRALSTLLAAVRVPENRQWVRGWLSGGFR